MDEVIIKKTKALTSFFITNFMLRQGHAAPAFEVQAKKKPKI